MGHPLALRAAPDMPIEDRVYPLLKHYIGAPQRVKSVLGAAYSALPLEWRYGARFKSFVAEIERSADLEWTRQRADERLRETLAWAAQTVPAYAPLREALHPDRPAAEWLKAFPLLDKGSIKADVRRYLSTRMSPRTHLLTHTGGSLSVPMQLYLEKYVSRSKDFAYNGAFDRIAGIGPGDVILALRGRSVPGADRPGGPISLYDPIKRYLQLSNNHLEPVHMPRHLEAMRRYRPSFIHAYPSAIEPVARWLEANPAPDVTERIRCVQLFSESVYDYQIDLLERVFGCPVILDYGLSERVVKAVSMPRDRRYFFWPLYGHLELVGPDGRAITQPGIAGEIVATGFDNRVMPLVRYRTGDVAAWSETPNTTRPGFKAVDRIEGRMQEFLVCKNHRVVSITSMCAAHFEVLVNADGMQFEQSVPGRAVLKIVSAADLSEQVKKVLVEGIRAKTEGGLEVEPVRVDELPRTSSGKHLLLRQHLDVAAILQAAVTTPSASGA